MISIDTIRIVDYAVIGVSGLSFILCIACALYAIPWNKERRRQEVTRDFIVFWKTRLVLQLASAVWLLVQWLRLTALWQPNSSIFPSRVTRWTGNGTLCRIYLCVSMGLLEPFCLFTAVLLCRSTLSKRRPQELGWPNAWVLGVALLLTVPFAAAQTVIAWISVIVPGRNWEQSMSVLHYFLASYVVGTAQQCDHTDGSRCILCMFPAASCIASAIAAALAALLVWLVTRRMIATVINRRLRCRLRTFQITLIAVLVFSSATRAATLVRGTPFGWTFQMIWLGHFVSLPVLVAIYTAFLVVLPVWDTSRASKGVQKMQKAAGAAVQPVARLNSIGERETELLVHDSDKSEKPA